jgi:hypothetical protein
MMRSSGLLFVLFTVTTANAVPAPTGETSRPPPSGIMLAAAGGRDTVGGLTPLPLWPPYTPRVYAPAPRVWKHGGRYCSGNLCRH